MEQKNASMGRTIFERTMGYRIDATLAGHVTIQQRAQRLGQAMDGNTMRWLCTYLYATQLSISPTPVPAVRKRKNRQQIPEETPVILDHDEVHHHQACAVVEQLINMDLQRSSTPYNLLGEGDTVKEKYFDIVDRKLSKESERVDNKFLKRR